MSLRVSGCVDAFADLFLLEPFLADLLVDGRIPVEHDIVGVNGVRITVVSMEGKRAGRLLISRNY